MQSCWIHVHKVTMKNEITVYIKQSVFAPGTDLELYFSWLTESKSQSGNAHFMVEFQTYRISFGYHTPKFIHILLVKSLGQGQCQGIKKTYTLYAHIITVCVRQVWYLLTSKLIYISSIHLFNKYINTKSFSYIKVGFQIMFIQE